MTRAPSISDARALFHWWRLLRGIRPDVLVAGSPKASSLALMAARAVHVGTRIYALYGLRAEGSRGVRGRVVELMERVPVAAATQVVAVSVSLANLAIERGVVEKAKVGVLGRGSSNGVDLSRYRVRGAETPPGVPVIGYVGRLARDKGIRELSAALQSMVRAGLEFRVLLVGPIDDSDGATGLAAIQGIDRDVRWTGSVDDVSPFLPEMDLLCLPSYREGLPNVLLEAFASGIPVVATNVTGVTDLVVPSETGWLVEARDASALASTMTAALRDSSASLKMAAHAREIVEQHYASDVVQEAWLDFIERSSADVPPR